MLGKFTDDELRCKGTGILKLHPGFRDKLEDLRKKFGKAMIITSCCRSPDYNKKIGGNPRSLHMTENPTHKTEGTMAADISIAGWSDAQYDEFVTLAWNDGWSVGENPKKKFVHIDRRVDIGLEQKRFDY